MPSTHEPKYRRFAPLPQKCPHCGEVKPLNPTARKSPNRRAKCLHCGEMIKLRAPLAFCDVDGRRVWLGPFNSEASKEKHKQILAARRAVQLGTLPDVAPEAGDSLTISELVLAYYRWALVHFADRSSPPDAAGHHRPGRTVESIKAAVNRLRRMYGATLVKDFGPRALVTLRDAMIREEKPVRTQHPAPELIAAVRELRNQGKSLRVISQETKATVARVRSILAGTFDDENKTGETLSRNYINSVITRIRNVFKWGVENELVDVLVFQRLKTVAALKKGRCDARESEPSRGVEQQYVDPVLQHVSPTIATMMRLQQITGMRPGEICRLRATCIDMSRDVWFYTPEKHKTEHHGKSRVIALGPRAQLLIRPFLTTTGYLFSPRAVHEERVAKLRKNRKTKVQPSQQNRRVRNRQRAPGERYTPDSYRGAIRRACKRAGVPFWRPYDLRHNHATEVREAFGEEATSVRLGHSRISTTAIYGERNIALQTHVAKEIG